MRQKLSGRDHATMRDFEAGLPRHQLDLRQPYGAYKRETLLVPCKAQGASEAEQPRIHHGRARFLQDLSAECLLPGFIAFGTTPWPAPSLAIAADQHDMIVGGHTESIRAMGSALRNCSGSEPRTLRRRALQRTPTLSSFLIRFVVVQEFNREHIHRGQPRVFILRLKTTGSLGVSQGLTNCETNDGTPYTVGPDSKVEANAFISFGHRGKFEISSSRIQQAAGRSARSARGADGSSVGCP